MTDAEEELRSAVDHAARPDVTAAVRDLYDELAAEIEARRPRCDASGRCCRFDSYGHRLYVTSLELGAFVHQLKAIADHPAVPAGLPILQADACVFQINGLCGVHAIRPFGCRVFFCDPTSEAWQFDAYERFHARLKAMHETFSVPYFYVEWRSALRIIGVGGAATAIGAHPLD